VEGVVRINRKKCVFGVDIDFTVNEFVVDEGVKNLAQIISSITGENWRIIYDELEAISYAVIGKNQTWIAAIERMFDLHVHCAGDRLIERLWSIVAKFLLYMESKGFDPAKLYQQATDAENAFWEGVGEKSKLYHDAHDFRDVVRSLELPLFALTSSDARTIYRGDVGPHGRIEYDVGRSIRMKHKRLALSGVNALIPPQDIIVSDPFPKEDEGLWREQIFPRYPRRPDREPWVFLGDTVYDMLAASVAGVGTRIFLNRHNKPIPAEATHVVYSLTEAAQLVQGLC
jgi:hypothetical protein